MFNLIWNALLKAIEQRKESSLFISFFSDCSFLFYWNSCWIFMLIQRNKCSWIYHYHAMTAPYHISNILELVSFACFLFISSRSLFIWTKTLYKLAISSYQHAKEIAEEQRWFLMCYLLFGLDFSVIKHVNGCLIGLRISHQVCIFHWKNHLRRKEAVFMKNGVFSWGIWIFYCENLF